MFLATTTTNESQNIIQQIAELFNGIIKVSPFLLFIFEIVFVMQIIYLLVRAFIPFYILSMKKSQKKIAKSIEDLKDNQKEQLKIEKERLNIEKQRLQILKDKYKT